MVIDFSTIGVIKEPPVLLLCNADGTIIQPLGTAYNIKADICYNEMSSISFTVPAMVDGISTPHYNDIIGMRLINMCGWGMFVLVNPSVKSDGIREEKECKAYSLEYELTYKKCFFAEGTYNLWNPLSPNETILGMILNDLPSWSIGSVDSDLIGRYRTFSEEDDNTYNFLKSTLQTTYGCIFDFDTYNRKINVRSVDNDAQQQQVFLSQDNLIKELSIEEDTENIFTVLDVNGATDVDIRMVNPLGTNKIYNLDYFMNKSHFSQEMIDKWAAWKENYESKRQPYYDLSIDRMLKTAAYITEEAALNNVVNTEMGSLENERCVYVEFLAQMTDKTSADYVQTQANLDDVNQRIAVKQSEIDSQKVRLENIKASEAELASQLIDIQQSVSFDRFFTAEEMLILDKYFKEQSVEESTFVINEVEAFDSTDMSAHISEIKVEFGDYASETTTDTETRFVSTINGGNIVMSRIGDDSSLLNGEIVKASYDFIHDTGDIICSVYLNKGTVGTALFSNACLSIVGRGTKTEEDGFVVFTINDGQMYFTENTTDYERYSVSWDLLEYGKQCLNALAFPSFSFNVSASNFFSLNEFALFVNQVELGKRIYLKTKNDVLTPFLIGVTIDFNNPAALEMKFGDKYSASDNAFKLVDLLDESISMGRNLDANKYNYMSYVNSGASTEVKRFMNAALDVAKNAVLSSSGQGVSWDGTGLHLRKYKNPDDPSSGFDPEQIWMINNNIVFTDDGWNTAKMAVGKIFDENIARYVQTSDTEYVQDKTYYVLDSGGDYSEWDGDESDWDERPALYEKDATAFGIVAPYIVGTLLAGENLVIDTENGAFKVDASGVHIDSLKFYITHNSGGGSEDISLADELSKIGDADSLMGTINLSQAVMQNTNGNIVIDDKGMWLLNGTSKETSTEAVWINENGILFGYGALNHIDTPADEDYAWNWTTAIGHNGIYSDAISSRTLDAFYINGSEFTGGSIKIGANGVDSDGNPKYNFIVDSSGNLTANNGTFRGTIEGATFKDSNGNLMTTGGGKFKSDYLDLLGLNIGNGNLVIDSNGNISMKGSITLGAGSSIDWSVVTPPSVPPATISDQELFDKLTNNGTKFGIFSSDAGQLVINADYIRSGSISTSRIQTDTDGYIRFASGVVMQNTLSALNGVMLGGGAEIYHDGLFLMAQTGGRQGYVITSSNIDEYIPAAKFG